MNPTLLFILLLLGASLAACSDKGSANTSKYQAGQVWTYKTRPGEEASRLTVLKVVPYGKGNAVHVCVEGVSIDNPNAPGSRITQIGHIPLAEDALDKSVVKCVASCSVVSLDGYNTWKEQADKGKAGVFTVTLAEAITVIESVFTKTTPATQAATSNAPQVWRTHPHLAGRFHPDFPDDVQVIVHDGGPRIAKHKPELVWVRVNGCAGNVFTGRVMNVPTQLTSVQQNQEIQFWVPVGSKNPVLVTSKYLAERGDWTILPCDKCGFSELFDAPSDLIRVIFPNMPKDYSMDTFTSFCPLCGGVQVMEHKSQK